MKQMRGFILILVLLTMGLSASSFAGEETAGDMAGGMGGKFVRGLGNVLSSPAEIPCAMRDDIKKDGAIGTATGLGKGLVYFVRRAFIGVCEVGTFMIPMPATLPTVCTEPASAAAPQPGAPQ